MEKYIELKSAIDNVVDQMRCSHSLISMVERLQNMETADVVARDCFDRIFEENDVMREQLASIGKKPGDYMDGIINIDEGIKLGAELAAMHGSDATSQELEKAYLEGVAYGMKRRDVKPVARGKWEKQDANLVWNAVGLYAAAYKCNRCGELNIAETSFCPNCGAMMEES